MNHCLAGILFDLDETLLDRSGTLQRYAAVLFSDFENSARIGFDEFDRLVTELDDHGVTPREAFFAGLADTAFPDIAAKALEDHFYAHAWSNPIPFPGVVDCLTEFRAKGIPTGIVTNGGIRSQSAKIRNSGVGSLVDAYLISEEFGIRKPEPEIFLHISEFLQIDPARSWFVGDDPVADIVGASSVGFRTVWLERHLPWPANHRKCYDLKAGQVSEVASELLIAA